MAAHKLGQVEAYSATREVLSELSTTADGALSPECNGFCRCKYATDGLHSDVEGTKRRLQDKFLLNSLEQEG